MMKKIETVQIVGMGALGTLFGSQMLTAMDPEHLIYVMDRDRYEKKRTSNSL
ncbi:MAG: hypothetical protein J6S45_00610 [Firmicutes bacterium]|nr:hypothetical protein [Bacillota bacterium]